MTTMKRRTFLKSTLASGVILAAASAGMLRPTRALAAGWPKNAFASKSIETALKNLYGSSATRPSKAIKIKAPLQAENGAVVPISVATTLPAVEAIGILVKGNMRPLASNVNLPKAAPFFSARIKMGKSSDVHVVVKAGGKLHTAKQNIKVTVGGCGG